MLVCVSRGNRKVKKTASPIGVAVIAALALAGCGGPESALDQVASGGWVSLSRGEQVDVCLHWIRDNLDNRNDIPDSAGAKQGLSCVEGNEMAIDVNYGCAEISDDVRVYWQPDRSAGGSATFGASLLGGAPNALAGRRNRPGAHSPPASGPLIAGW